MPLLDKSAFADPTLPVPSWSNIKGAVRGLMGMATPPDPYEEAGRMVQQARGGDYLGALETGFGAMPTTGAIKAYHGSPHSFDKFDLSKIGTGEGAQAYGHGLYFAEAEPVAREYRDALSRGYPVRIGGEDIDFSDPIHVAAKYMHDFQGDRGKAWLNLKNEITNYGEQMHPAHKGAKEQALRIIRNDEALPDVQKPGHMYEVNINADPEHFLDWDKPLGDQTDAVRKAILAAAETAPMPSKGPAIRNRQSIIGGDASVPGDVLYNNIGGFKRPAETSSLLREAGIPGIKYLDQGSRGAGEGSRNYVVFDDKLVDIARKYGLLPLGMGGFDFSQNEQK